MSKAVATTVASVREACGPTSAAELLYTVEAVAARGLDGAGKMDERRAEESTLPEDELEVGTELSTLVAVYAGVVPKVPGLPPPEPRALL